MTDMTDLEWLARNVSEFPLGAEYVMKTSGDKVLAWSWDDYCGQFPVFSKDQWKAERQRLGLDAPEWDGEGEFPPPNQECLVSVDGSKWEQGKVLAYPKDDHQTYVVFQLSSEAGWWYRGLGPDMVFAPLKSQEQREREEILAQAWRIMDGCDKGLSQMAAKLYDAGMLKKPD